MADNASLDTLLREEFDRSSPSPECREAIKAHLQSFNEENIKSRMRLEDVRRIHRLTRTARLIARNDMAFFDGTSEMLYQYHLLGLGIVENYPGEQISVVDLVSIQAHLLGDAGEFARHIFRQTKDEKWAERWFDGCNEAAEKNSMDLKYSSYQHSWAALAAEAMFQATGSILWLIEQKFESQLLAAEKGEKADVHWEYIMFNHSDAGQTSLRYLRILAQTVREYEMDSAYSRAIKREQIEWANKMFDCFSSAAGFAAHLKHVNYAFSQYFMGVAASVLYYRTGDRSWVTKAYDAFGMAIDYYHADSSRGELPRDQSVVDRTALRNSIRNLREIPEQEINDALNDMIYHTLNSELCRNIEKRVQMEMANL